MTKLSGVIPLAFAMLIFAGVIDVDGCCKSNRGPNRCGRNAGQTPCGAVCEPSCSNPRPEGCAAYCLTDGCRCNEGYLRDVYTKQCVRPECCTVPPPK